MRSLEPGDVDLVVDKVVDRYPQVGRLISTEPFVIVLDSVIVPSPAAPWTEDDARLIGGAASYMLGEETGRDWVARVRNERAVVGEGSVVLAIHREADGRRAVLEAFGAFSLFLPVVPTAGKVGAVDAISFDIRVANQEIAIPERGGAVDLYGEIVPRFASYSANGFVFRRWTNALFHLGWDERRAAAGPEPSRGAPPSPERSIASYLENARAQVGPLIRLGVRFEKTAAGTLRLADAAPNSVDLVLPSALVAGERALEASLARLSALHPGRIERRREDVLVRVGYFFFHADATGPGAPDAEARRRARAAKEFRAPEPPR
jgi:hypothetical protein